ncbi:hypothetical protein MP638_006529 [Amoeboaphelidium occidentale]|nr:hypothetical protein MP638_006529 [Amoeboaphelidium occidentale]
MTSTVLKNWAGTMEFECGCLLKPESEEEIIRILDKAHKESRGVKVVGAIHSPSDLTSTFRKEDYVLNLDKMNKVIDIKDTTEVEVEVEVEAGIRLYELNCILEQNGLALSSLGSISEQSLAGAISTGTHGTGIEYGPLSSCLVGLRFIHAAVNESHGLRFRVQECKKGDEMFQALVCSLGAIGVITRLRFIHAAVNESDGLRFRVQECKKGDEMFQALVCSLGAIGVITRLRLKVERKFQLKVSQYLVPFDFMLDNWEYLVKSGQHVRFWYFPYVDRVLVWSASRTTVEDTTHIAPAASPQSYWKDRVFGYHLLEGLLFLSRKSTLLTAAVNNVYFEYLFGMRYPLVTTLKELLNSAASIPTYTDTSYKVFNFDCLFKQYVTEWCVEWKNDARNVLKELKQEILDRQLPAQFPVEIRFVAKDDSLIGPTSDGAKCYIGIIAYRPYGTEPAKKDEYWAVYEQIMRKYKGKPHWAKQHTLTYEELKQLYPGLERFRELMFSLDPTGMFDNEYLQRHFHSKRQLKSRL